jgi:hypothetical protein
MFRDHLERGGCGVSSGFRDVEYGGAVMMVERVAWGRGGSSQFDDSGDVGVGGGPKDIFAGALKVRQHLYSP